MTSPPPSRDLTRTMLAVLFFVALIVVNFFILKPFLPAFVWAVTIVVATWPLMLRLQAWLGGRRGFAVAVMTLALLLLLIVPFTLAVVTLLDNADMIKGWAESLKAKGLPPPPGWVTGIPLVGPSLSESWQELASAGPEGLSAQVVPYAGKIVNWFVDQAGGIGMMFVQFMLTVIICAILYAGGEPAADSIRRFFRRLAGHRGEDVTVLAARAIRGVALGVVVTAVVQSLLGGIGLAVAGVPAAAVLTAIMFMLCIAQLGPALILIPAVIWLYWSGQTLWGTVLLFFAIVAMTLDNFLRPILIRKGADLPLLLIFTGVIGGLIAFGIIGLFIGPVVLAVTYTLLGAWVDSGESNPPGGKA
jgi:predicted PurR-regulated permease PerM